MTPEDVLMLASCDGRGATVQVNGERARVVNFNLGVPTAPLLIIQTATGRTVAGCAQVDLVGVPAQVAVRLREHQAKIASEIAWLESKFKSIDAMLALEGKA